MAEDATTTGLVPAAEPAPLLGSGDPPPFEVVNRDGSARAVLICDHAGRAIPRALGRLGLDDAALARHIAWDIGIADVTRKLAKKLDAAAVLAGYSRLVIDCNRRLDDPTSIAQESDGVEVPGNRGLTADDRARRAASCFAPYHAAVDAVIAGRRRPRFRARPRSTNRRDGSILAYFQRQPGRVIVSPVDDDPTSRATSSSGR